MGSVVISVDAELGWGFHDQAAPPEQRVEAGRRGWRTLQGLFDRYRVPATWAVVGHLLLEDCDGCHPDHPVPSGWFARERGDWADRPDLRFGGELVDSLLAADVDHEVGCHTFSHVILTDPRITADTVRAELYASAEAAGSRGLTPRSFVFPRNRVAHRSVLADCGYRAYRAPGAGQPSREGRREKLRRLFGREPPLVRPTVDEFGAVAVPSSLYLFGFEGLPRTVAETVWTDPVVRQATRGIDAAAEADEETLFHLWLHPNNLVEPRDVDRVDAVLSHLRTRLSGTELTVETMGQVADRLLDGEDGGPTP